MLKGVKISVSQVLLLLPEEDENTNTNDELINRTRQIRINILDEENYNDEDKDSKISKRMNKLVELSKLNPLIKIKFDCNTFNNLCQYKMVSKRFISKIPYPVTANIGQYGGKKKNKTKKQKKQTAKTEKANKSKKHMKNWRKQSKKALRKHSRKSRHRFSKKIRGGDLPSNQEPREPNEEMLIDPRDIQDIEEETDAINEEVNYFITNVLNSSYIEQNSKPTVVYSIMVKVLEIWNRAIDQYRQGELREIDLNAIRTVINNIYDRVVKVTPQDSAFIHQDGEEPLPEIINYRSSAILEDMFDYVANIYSDDVNNRINDRIEIPNYERTYGAIPDEDKPDFDTDDGSEDEMDTSQ